MEAASLLEAMEALNESAGKNNADKKHLSHRIVSNYDKRMDELKNKLKKATSEKERSVINKQIELEKHFYEQAKRDIEENKNYSGKFVGSVEDGKKYAESSRRFVDNAQASHDKKNNKDEKFKQFHEKINNRV